MVSLTSPARARSLQETVAPAAIASTTRETAQGTPFEGTLIESLHTGAQPHADPSGSSPVKGEGVGRVQPAGKNIEVLQAEAQPLVENATVMQQAHGQAEMHIVSEETGHAPQPDPGTSKQRLGVDNESDTKADAESALPQTDKVKDSGKQQRAQKIAVATQPCAPHSGRVSTLQRDGSSMRSSVTSTPVEQSHDSQILAVKGTSLEVGTSSEVHYRVPVGARMDKSGSATVADVAPSTISSENPTPHLAAMSDASGSAPTEGQYVCRVQPAVKDAEVHQAEAQPLVEDTAVLQQAPRPTNVHRVSPKHGHTSQSNIGTSKTKIPENHKTDVKADAKIGPDKEISAGSNEGRCVVDIPGNLIPSIPPAGQASSPPPVRDELAIRTKASSSSPKQPATVRTQGEPTGVPGKLINVSGAVLQTDAVKDSGEHHAAPTTDHGSQGTTVHSQLSAAPAGRLSNLQPAAFSMRSPASSTPDEQPGDPRTLAATATSLEVGISSGTHGWLRIRAELDQSGTVTAAVVASSAASAENLTKHLPAMSEYLAQETTKIGSIVVHASSHSGAAADSSHSSAAWSGLPNSAAGQRDSRQSDSEKGFSADSERRARAERNTEDTPFDLQPIRAAWPGLMPGLPPRQLGTGTHWVSVRV